MPTNELDRHEPVLVRAAEAETLASDPQSVLTLLADSDQTGGILSSNRSLLKAGSDGAPPHLHKRQSELFFVLDGALEVLIDQQIRKLEKGDFLVVPAGVPHAFGPAKDTDADVLFVFTPGVERFEYYRLLDRVYGGEADWDDLKETSDRFDNHYVESDVWTSARTP